MKQPSSAKCYWTDYPVLTNWALPVTLKTFTNRWSRSGILTPLPYFARLFELSSTGCRLRLRRRRTTKTLILAITYSFLYKFCSILTHNVP